MGADARRCCRCCGDLQGAYGRISPEQVHRVSHLLRVPEADIFGVIGFLYALSTTSRLVAASSAFAPIPAAPWLAPMRSCMAFAGVLASTRAARPPMANTPVEHSPCLGLCDYAPAALVSARGEADLALPKASASDLLGEWRGDYFRPAGDQRSVLLNPQTERRARDAGRVWRLRIAETRHRRIDAGKT